MYRRTLLRQIAVVGMPLGAGCSGTGPDDGTTPATTAPTGPPAPTEQTADPTQTTTATPESAQGAYPNYDWDQLEEVAAEPTDTIRMSGLEFVPAVVAVTPGTHITVTNEDAAGHTITIPALGIDRRVGNGARVTFTVEDTGTFGFVCTLHPPDMLGRLIVTQTPPTATPTPTATTTTDEEDDDYGGGYGY